MKAIVFSTQPFEREGFGRLTDGCHELHFTENPLNPQTARQARGYPAVSVFVHDDLCAATLQILASEGVALVALRGAGYNRIDIPAARAYKIKVLRVPAYSPEAVAEHAAALVLALSRKTHKAYHRVRENNFSLEHLMGFNLHGKTVGIIGMGRIGLAFSRIMKGFGCRVLACDLTGPSEIGSAEYLPFEQVLALSDILSLHCPLTADNHHLIDGHALARMKRGAMLINTARGGLLDTKAAIAALKSGQLGFLGVDVYEGEEPLFMKDLSGGIVEDDLIERLMAFGNVLVTPHQGFFTGEAVAEILRTTLENLSAFEEGKPLENEVLFR